METFFKFECHFVLMATIYPSYILRFAMPVGFTLAYGSIMLSKWIVKQESEGLRASLSSSHSCLLLSPSLAAISLPIVLYWLRLSSSGQKFSHSPPLLGGLGDGFLDLGWPSNPINLDDESMGSSVAIVVAPNSSDYNGTKG